MLGYNSLIKEWYENGRRYIDGDVVKFGYVDMCVLHCIEYNCDFASDIDKYLLQIDNEINQPWEVYSTNRFPKYRKCGVVRFLYNEFCLEFGSIFGVLNIYGGGSNGCILSKDMFKPSRNLIINKSYIKWSEDGYIVVYNPDKFKRDILVFERRMKSVFAKNHYSWEELDRLHAYLRPPVRVIEEDIIKKREFDINEEHNKSESLKRLNDIAINKDIFKDVVVEKVYFSTHVMGYNEGWDVGCFIAYYNQPFEDIGVTIHIHSSITNSYGLWWWGKPVGFIVCISDEYNTVNISQDKISEKFKSELNSKCIEALHQYNNMYVNPHNDKWVNFLDDMNVDISTLKYVFK